MPCGQLYWFWRDRKGLVGNLLTPFANLFFLYGTARNLANRNQAVQCQIGAQLPLWLVSICQVTFGIAALQAGVRAYSAATIYGWKFAAGVPVRMVWGNLVNFAATATALWEFWDARLSGQGLAWNKTDHVYPTAQAALIGNGVHFEEIANVRSSSAGGD